MKKIRIGVLCPSEIAFRRFMPALSGLKDFTYVGVAIANKWEWFGRPTEALLTAERKKADQFRQTYGGTVFASYRELLESPKVDAVYLPLPPGLHYRWGKEVLKADKHLLMEKPFTTSLQNTRELLALAGQKELAVHENYMFVYHSQLDYIREWITGGALGEMRLIRIDFGFPFRGTSDFRYNRALGGGALLDCGGYTLKLATLLLGETAEITASQLNTKDGLEVDIYGSATLTNAAGLTAQVSFGMDNSYRCSLDVWGSAGHLYANRILTAPDGFEPTVVISQGDEERVVTLPADDTFRKSIEHFGKCVINAEMRENNRQAIDKQSQLVEKIGGWADESDRARD